MTTITGSKQLTAAVKTINPRLAKEMLRTGIRNRKVTASRVNRLAKAMRLEEWIIAQPLMLNCDGTLIDGQHRLHAVIQSGKAIPLLIVGGFDRAETFAKLDDTATRRLRDWLHIRGEALPDVLAAVIQYAIRDSAGRIPTGGWGGIYITSIEGVEFLESHPKIRDSVNSAPAVVNRFASRAMFCFAHYKFSEQDSTLADSFLVDLVTDDNEGATDPLYLLRERLKTNRRAKVKLSPTETLALIFKAWNAVRRDETLKVLAWRSTGPSAEAFPEVI